MRSADAEPNTGEASWGHDYYRLFRVADRSADHDRRFLSATFKEGEPGSGGPVAIEGALVLPGRPDDTGEAVGECDGGSSAPSAASGRGVCRRAAPGGQRATPSEPHAPGAFCSTHRLAWRSCPGAAARHWSVRWE